jgi:tetratricopeptide (TPR) repeat protein
MSRAFLSVALLLSTLAAGADSLAAKGEIKGRLSTIEQHLAAWNVDEAQTQLDALESSLPAGLHNLEPLRYFRGRVLFEQGKYAEAIEQFKQAGVDDSAGSYLRLAKDTLSVVGEHQRIESAHFIFLFPAGKDAVLAPYALETLEAIRTALETDFGYVPKNKVRVEVVSNAAALAKVSTLTKEQIRTTGTIAICKFNKLMVTSPKAVIRGYDWLDTLAHEYVHLVVSQKSQNTVPIWMHEGLAKYLESRWRGSPGGAMTPSTLALLGSRVKTNTLVPFEKMHPSMALLPTAEDAATAFAEVFFAMDYLYRELGPGAFKGLLNKMAAGVNDKGAVEAVTKKSWAAFEKGWLAHIKKQPFPKELIPPSSNERKELAENAVAKAKKSKEKEKRDISFGDFAEISETDARKWAHLGEVMRERGRMGAAAEHYGRAYDKVGSRYESVSNKYALTLMELSRFDDAEKVLKTSLEMHPGSAQTNVHRGRLAIRKNEWAKAKDAYLQALAVNPFDEEVHVGLLRSALSLGDTQLVTQARAAVVTLLKISAQDATTLALSYLVRDDLVNIGFQKNDNGEKAFDAGS